MGKGLFWVALSILSAGGFFQARNSEAEFADMVRLLDLKAGSVAADVGAGGGAWTRLLLEEVGADGHVFATEVKSHLVEGILSSHATAQNLSVILANDLTMGLPPHCCDAVLLRLVYHAFDHPEAMRRSLARAVRPGGRVLIVDFPGGGRGVKPEDLTRDLAAAGFQRLEYIESWQGQEGLYALLFRRQ